MSVYTFIIGSADDFESIDALIDYVESLHGGITELGQLNYSTFEFDMPSDCSEELVTMVGRGYAFSNDWCADHTFSLCISGTLDV